MKIVFITSLFGNRGNKPAVKFDRVKGCQYFLFSDRGQEYFKTSWDVHNISNNPNLSSLNCNIRKSRYAKFMGWELLDSMGIDYDCIYYCDAHYSPRSNIDWISLSNTFISKTYPFLQGLHKVTNHDGINREFKLMKNFGKDSDANIEKTRLFFKKEFPEIPLSGTKFFENGFFGYSPNDLVKKITKNFWEIYTQSDITFRDQPTWNLLLLKHGVTPQFLESLRGYFAHNGEYGNHEYL